MCTRPRPSLVRCGAGTSMCSPRKRTARDACRIPIFFASMNESLTSEVIHFVAQKTGITSERITAETTLFGDLGVDGDDARELFRAFSEQFHVNLSGFQFARHFGNEGLWPHQIPILVWRLF